METLIKTTCKETDTNCSIAMQIYGLYITRQALICKILTCYPESLWYGPIDVLELVGNMMSYIVSVHISFASAGGVPIILRYSLLDNSSYHVSCLASIDEDVHIAESESILEIQLLSRNSFALVLDELLIAVFHSCYSSLIMCDFL